MAVTIEEKLGLNGKQKNIFRRIVEALDLVEDDSANDFDTFFQENVNVEQINNDMSDEGTTEGSGTESDS